MQSLKIYNFTDIINVDNKPLTCIWGYFDGWHKGHQNLLKTAQFEANNNNSDLVVISFNKKPQSVFSQQKNYLLFSKIEKKHFLKKNGIKFYWEVNFTKKISQVSANVFIEWLIKNNVKTVIVSKNVRFGTNALGDLKLLQSSSLNVVKANLIFDNFGNRISSTYIKQLLIDKNIEQANYCLNNREYSIKGKVIHGIKEGRKLGFPTANLKLITNYCVPGLGIYMTLTKINKKWWNSLTVIMLRDNKLLVETYILNFNKNLYNKILKIKFLKFLRDNKFFSSSQDLVKQINDDIKKAELFFNNFKTYNHY